MSKRVRVSAFIDVSMKDLLDRHVRATGIKRGRLVDEALRHYLLALIQSPQDFVHPRIVLTRAAGTAIRKELRAGNPTKALRDLMRRGS